MCKKERASMPALYIAKSADVPRLLFAPGEKRAGFYFVT